MANQTGIAIVIKAFLPTGKTLDEQFAALSAVKAAHESGDYTTLLKTAAIEEVKTEQKTRRVPDAQPQGAAETAPQTAPAAPAPHMPEAQTLAPLPGGQSGDEVIDDADVPDFLKNKKKDKAA